MQSQDFFTVKDNIGEIKGFTRRRNEGSDFWTGGGAQLKSNLISDRIKNIFITVVLTLFVIWARVFWLQVVWGEEYRTIAEGNRIRLEEIQAERGIIYDRFGKPLVENVPRMSIYFVPADLPETEEERLILAGRLAAVVNQSADEIMARFNNTESYSYKYELLSDDVGYEQAIMFRADENNLPGARLEIEFRRQYLEEGGLSHVLGYVGRINRDELDRLNSQGYDLNDYIGKDGVEFYHEDRLRGTDGVREVEVDALGKPKKILNQKEPVIGESLVLTIDLELQKKLTDSLNRAILVSGTGNGAVGVAVDPQSGEILALVSLPGFDNNFFSAGIQRDAYHNYLDDPARPLFNRAIAGSYPPGSTFKPIVAAAALEEGLVNKNKTFLSTGGIRVGDWFFPDWKYGGHGRVNIVKALSESVNTFFYYVGGGYSDFSGLGVDRIVAYASKFGLGSKLGIDLPGEASGFLPSKDWKESVKGEAWYIGDTYHLAIGQGDVLVTPLQVAAYTGVIANGGVLRGPYLLKGAMNAKAGTDDRPADNDHVISNKIISSESVEIIREGLRATVLSGSARSLQSLPVSAAGKTGTAQVGGDDNTHAWFTGFAPYENPKIVLTVLIENGGGGDVAAVPVFQEVISWYFSDK